MSKSINTVIFPPFRGKSPWCFLDFAMVHTPFGGRSAALTGPRWAMRLFFALLLSENKWDIVKIKTNNSRNRIACREAAPYGAAGTS